MSEALNKPVVASRVCLFFVLFGLLLMGAGSLAYLKKSPSMVREFKQSAGQATTDSENAMVAALMRRVAENPSDVEALGVLGRLFLEKNDWPNAEIFFNRAVVAEPSDAMLSYMLGLAQARTGKLHEAEANFLRAVDLGGPSEVRLSLAILYSHFLEDQDKARPIFQELVENPHTPDDVRNVAKEELEAR